MKVQSIIFDKSYWNVTESRKWLRAHNYVYNGKVDTTKNFHRFRQSRPVKGSTYYTVTLPNRIELVITK